MSFRIRVLSVPFVFQDRPGFVAHCVVENGSLQVPTTASIEGTNTAVEVLGCALGGGLLEPTGSVELWVRCEEIEPESLVGRHLIPEPTT